METLENACYKAICCLNPYCNGRYSWRAIKKLVAMFYPYVLILIVMEDTHGVSVEYTAVAESESLNPYCNGRYSWRWV